MALSDDSIKEHPQLTILGLEDRIRELEAALVEARSHAEKIDRHWKRCMQERTKAEAERGEAVELLQKHFKSHSKVAPFLARIGKRSA